MIDLKFDLVTKKYLIRQEAPAGDSARHPLVRRLQNLRRPPQEFLAVKNVSFEVRRGEALGIIGHNGAGKSTVLKLLANITAPTSGEITIDGRLSALIEVGSGFHPELSGRENVYLSGSILGMRRRDIGEKLDSIIEFAGVRQFIDTPVKRYSSGMYVRLGFSIAAHLDPDILLLDEVLAVGDSAFQAKCLQRVKDLRQSGKTIIFISHDLSAVEKLCSRVLLMERGEVVASGAPAEVIAEYRRTANDFVPSGPPSWSNEQMSRRAEITSLDFYDAVGRETSTASTGSPVTVRLKYKSHEQIPDAIFEVFFYASNGELKCQLSTGLSHGRIDLEAGRGEVEFSCAELGLQVDTYYIDAAIQRHEPSELIDWQYRCAMFHVGAGKVSRGTFYMPHEWRITQERSVGSTESAELLLR